MTATGAFFRKELAEIGRTWRIWVVPGIVLFFAASSPVIALLTPALVASLAGEGITISVPDPTALDAYRQFLKNLTQIALVALIVTSAGSIPGERKQGMAILALTKPLPRAGFVFAKLASQLGLLLVSAAIGVVACYLVTTLLFDGARLPPLLAAVGLWTAIAAVLVTAVTLISVTLNSQVGAAGIGLGVYFVLLLAGSWRWAADNTFAGLPGAADAVLTGAPTDLMWPMVTAAIAILVLAGAAAIAFGRKEL